MIRQYFDKDPDLAKAYQEWLASPITQKVVALLREVAEPQTISTSAPGVDLGDMALFANGVNLGMNAIVRLFDGRDVVSETSKKMHNKLVPSYGAERELKKEED